VLGGPLRSDVGRAVGAVDSARAKGENVSTKPGGAGSAWRPLQAPSSPRPTGPFARLARTHAAVAAGDALVAIMLAGSLFFDISPTAARGKVALYLLFTMAPFAVVSPLVGPALDRAPGARRLIVIGGAAIRSVVCLLAVGRLGSVVLFPLAFVLLVLSKAYAISKSSIVPTTVDNEEELVEANSKLGLVSSLAGFVIAVPALIMRLAFGANGVAVLAVLVFAAATVFAMRIPSRPAVGSVAATDDDDAGRVRTAGITLAASATAFVRACVGFLSFHLAFWFRSTDASTAWFGVVLGASAAGAVSGNSLAPRIRRRVREETMLAAALGVIGAGGLFAAFQGGKLGATLLSFVVGLGAAVGRLAFDAIVQRDANDANRGRAFAQFETRFQLAWVAAAFVPVIATIPGWLGFAIVGGLGAFAVASYLVGARYVREHGRLRATLTNRAVGEFRKRRANELGRPVKRRRNMPR
jgi:hypothetical protein